MSSRACEQIASIRVGSSAQRLLLERPLDQSAHLVGRGTLQRVQASLADTHASSYRCVVAARESAHVTCRSVQVESAGHDREASDDAVRAVVSQGQRVRRLRTGRAHGRDHVVSPTGRVEATARRDCALSRARRCHVHRRATQCSRRLEANEALSQVGRTVR